MKKTLLNGFNSVEDVLNGFKDGEISLDDAERMLKGQMMQEVENLATLDIFREVRTGTPEIIFAESKAIDDLKMIISNFLETKGIAVISRLTPEQEAMVQESFPGMIELKEKANMAVIKKEDYTIEPCGGIVGIITAGTSDIAIAEEAATVCEVMGCTVERAYDVGIAGLHRVFKPMKMFIEKNVDIIICCAGMEGALPSVIASLTDVLVIGVPIATGYGFGGQGVTALSSMLQSCSPGLVVVNINNGIGAGAAAAIVSRKMGRLRSKAGESSQQDG
ncbi:MAG TPA: nickel pincer cofactor biosynthesis protein LarB [Candidatus Lokiarchaeia archaeon]|nr:nickel pincer cofactor biosynthesis protein LarB [Candidatus Lokiarchaeia archaeon]